MKMHRTLWGFLREWIFGDPLQKQYERMEQAFKDHAKAASDAEYERRLADFFTERVLGIDPWKDHNGFADERTKQLDHQAKYLVHEARTQQTAEVADAERARYFSLQRGPAGVHEGATP